MRTSTQTLASAVRILSDQIKGGDGVAQITLLEASDRLTEQSESLDRLRRKLANLASVGRRLIDSGFSDVEARRLLDEQVYAAEIGHD